MDQYKDLYHTAYYIQVKESDYWLCLKNLYPPFTIFKQSFYILIENFKISKGYELQRQKWK